MSKSKVVPALLAWTLASSALSGAETYSTLWSTAPKRLLLEQTDFKNRAQKGTPRLIAEGGIITIGGAVYGVIQGSENHISAFFDRAAKCADTGYSDKIADKLESYVGLAGRAGLRANQVLFGIPGMILGSLIAGGHMGLNEALSAGAAQNDHKCAKQPAREPASTRGPR